MDILQHRLGDLARLLMVLFEINSLLTKAPRCGCKFEIHHQTGDYILYSLRTSY